MESEIDFGDMGMGKGYWNFAQDGNDVKVTWGMKTNMGANPIARYIGLFMDGMVGPDFEKGLKTMEKEVKELQKLINKEAELKAAMTNDSTTVDVETE